MSLRSAASSTAGTSAIAIPTRLEIRAVPTRRRPQGQGAGIVELDAHAARRASFLRACARLRPGAQRSSSSDDRRGAPDNPQLLGRGQAAGVALHEQRAAQDRERERIERALLGLDCVGFRAHEIAERSGLRLVEAG